MNKTDNGPRVSGRGREVLDLIANRKPFRTHGALKAVAGAASARLGGDLGYLPKMYQNDLVSAALNGRVDYLVRSYATPIAYHDTERGWIIPDVKYSTTTSRHQSKVRSGLALAGIEYNDK